MRSVLNIHWKNCCWSGSYNTLAIWCEELTHLKRPWCWERWREEKGTTEEEIVGWQHQLNGYEFELTPGVGNGQGGLACCSPWGCKESDMTEQLNWMNHNKLWKILKEMGIPDHLTCLFRNLYAGQKSTVRTGHATTDWLKSGKGVCQVCIMSPCLFNLYAA